MSRKLVLLMTLMIVLISMFSVVLGFRKVKAGRTIYIRADGSVDPSTAPILNVGNVHYTLTANISDSIVVERDNIVVDGAGYTVQGVGDENFNENVGNVQMNLVPEPEIGPEPEEVPGIDLSGRSNVTIKDINIKGFDHGVYLQGASNNIISGNNITNNGNGIELEAFSDNNSIYGNNLTNNHFGIYLYGSCNYNSMYGNNVVNNSGGITLFGSCNYNSISKNKITSSSDGIGFYDSSNNDVCGNKITGSNYTGIELDSSSNNSISRNHIANSNYAGICLTFASDNNIVSENNLTNNDFGIYLFDSLNNSICHNNFVNNREQVHDYSWDDPQATPSVNTWDDGYPSGGNYWSDYNGTDYYSGPYQNEIGSDGIGDISYVIDSNNTDRYPLMEIIPEDITPPNIAVLSPENKTYAVNYVALTFTVSESTSWIGYSLDGKGNVTIAGNTTLSDLSDGSHSLIVYAIDTTGNTGTSETIYFTIETPPPEPFPTWIIAVIVTIAGVGVSLLIYFTKFKKTTQKVK